MTTTTAALASATPSSRGLPVGNGLDDEALSFWPQANRHVLWGWKRDEGDLSRMVYFSGQLDLAATEVDLHRHYFFYKHRAPAETAQRLYDQLDQARARFSALSGPTRLQLLDCRRSGFKIVRLAAGYPTEEDKDRVRRLQLRRPRQNLGTVTLPEPAPMENLAAHLPFDLYIGSGASYEAGLPTLCEMHDAFCLDDHAGDRFTFGDADELPQWLAKDFEGTLRRFCTLHVKALTAQPTEAYKVIARLKAAGQIGTLMSDNVDNLMCKLHLPFERTRGSGVFNERHPAQFQTNTLVVVGVAADRREIVQQARARRMRVVVVNPCARVSPRVQHLNYIRPSDIFYRTTAQDFFTRLDQAPG